MSNGHREQKPGKITRIPTIHRDGTFVYKGETYTISGGNANGGNEGFAYEIGWDDPNSMRSEMVDDSMFTMREIRAWLRRAVEEDWPTLREGGTY